MRLPDYLRDYYLELLAEIVAADTNVTLPPDIAVEVRAHNQRAADVLVEAMQAVDEDPPIE